MGVPARAASLSPSSVPLEGSSFQGADGDQDEAAALVDWGSLQSAGWVVHSADANAQDTAFAGGTKEGEPDQWRLSTEKDGVDPGKANILDAWSAVDQPGARTFLYLAFARAAPNGDTFLTFELNQDARLWTNSAGTKIPCRRDGDVLVSYEIAGNGAEVVLNRWRTDETDPGSGCARTGSIEPLATVPADAAQGALNSGAIANHLPGSVGATVPAGQFGEAALDLEALLGHAFPGGCFGFGSIWMHSRSSQSDSSQMQDYLAPQPIELRTCAAAGTKFFDLDADGQRDPGEPGLPGFEIFADYDGDGRMDPGEPSTVSDRRGHYVLQDIRPQHAGAYRLRERLATRRRTPRDWRCSYPNAGTAGGFGAVSRSLACGWGVIDADEEPYATGKDFGNWYPAQLTVKKVLAPAEDTGRFDLTVNGTTVVTGAGNGSARTIEVPPGVYGVTEQAVPPTDPSSYRSLVECKRLTGRRQLRLGTSFDGLRLPAGGRAICTFRNVRTGSPAIAIDKSGPAVAIAGRSLHYTLLVTNPGNVPFPARRVTVSDPACGAAPALETKADADGPDDSPATLDPGDSWSYACTRETQASTGNCPFSLVQNTATVTGSTGGATVEDDSTIQTTLICRGVRLTPLTPTVPPRPPGTPVPPIAPAPPHPPAPPQPPGPIPPAPVVPGQPVEPGAVAPPGPAPPVAGRAGTARFALPTRRACVSRIPRLRLSGTRISRVSVFVDGRIVGRRSLTSLQRRTSVSRVRQVGAGSHLVTVRVSFRLGSGTRPLTLTRRVTVCAAARPRFTG